MADSSSSNPVTMGKASARPSKLKSVTFTGCWTCRSRKVKCDERQENGCGVCERTGLECAGYGVSLCWVTGDKKLDHQAHSRRRIQPDRSSSLSMPDEEVTRILSALDTISTPKSTVTMGPFAIFSGQADSREESPPSFDFALDDTMLDIPGPDHQRLLGDGMTDLDTSNVPFIHDIDTIVESAGLDLIPSSDFLYPNQPTSPLLPKSPTPPSPHLGLPIPLFQDPQTSTLMYHYMNHVAELLQPVLHPSNPWRTTYFPFALEGCPELFLSQGSTPSSHASIALFHSLLSSAAFHLRNATPDSKQFHQLGLQHRTKSLHALNAALVYPNDAQLYTVYLTAMLSLVTIDTITGEDVDFPIHLKACRQLRKPSSVGSDSNGQVDSICHFLTLLSRTTSLDIEPRVWETPPLLDQTPRFRSDERNIEYIYGITPTLGNLLERTCQIAEYLTFYQGYMPAFVHPVAETLKNELCSWTIESEPFSSISNEQGTMHEIARCQARAFHSAVLIFYHRTIEDSPINLEPEVRVIWTNLTEAENLKDEFMGGEKRAAPMSWPAFIAACEAADRLPWVGWWNRVQGYRVGNFTKQWRVIQRLWEIMDTHENVTSWRDALKVSGELILPI